MDISEPKLAVSLPPHNDSVNIVNCYRCGGEMWECTASLVFKVKNEKVRVSNIQVHRCRACRENVYSSAEAEMIENAINSVIEGGIK